MPTLSKLLIGWALTILALIYLAAGVSLAVDAFTTSGWGGLVVALVLLSALPSMIAGVIITELSDRRKIKPWLEP